MNKKYYKSTAKFPKVITICLAILALQVNTVKAQVSFITNGQSIQITNSWDIKLVDINGDGHLDAYFGGKTWLNNGNGNISETNLSFGSGIFASFGDINGDGFVDVVCQDSIYLNDGDNHYEFKIKLSSDIAMYSSVLADVDNDGDIDIISCSTTTDRILFNDGKANFTNSGKSLGGWGQASYTFGDINSDGFTDIYVAIPHTPPPAMKHSANKIWFGDGKSNFSEKNHDIPNAICRSAMLSDFDGDGDIDLFVASNGSTGNMIFQNDGKGNFTDSGQKLGNNSNSAKAADFDGDGDFDLFICHGEVPFGDGAPNRVWYNDGKGHFADSKLSLGNSNSAAVALGDMNNDGKIDAVIVNVKLDPKNNYTSVPCPVEIWINKPFESNNLNETIEYSLELSGNKLKGSSLQFPRYDVSIILPSDFSDDSLSINYLFKTIQNHDIKGEFIFPNGKTSEIKYSLIPYNDSTTVFMKTSNGWYPWDKLRIENKKLIFSYDYWYCPLATKADLEILDLCSDYLKDSTSWNQNDDRKCDNDKSDKLWSLFCAIKIASIEIYGEYNHRGFVIQTARFLIDELNPNHEYAHTLMDFNNDSSTTFDDIIKVLTIVKKRIKEELSTK